MSRTWFQEAEISRKREVMREKILRLRDREAARQAEGAARAGKAAEAVQGAGARARRPRSSLGHDSVV